MCRSPSWLIMSWCLTSAGLNLFASAAPLPVPAPDRVDGIGPLVADRDFWTERCSQNPESSIGSKIRPLEVICGYLRRTKSTPIRSSEEKEEDMSLYRILRNYGMLRRRKEDGSEDERLQSKRQGDVVGKSLQKEALGKDGPQPKAAWNGEAGYNQDVWSPIPIAEVPVASDDSVDKRSEGGSRENPSSGSDLERFLESKREGDRMTREKTVHGAQGTGHPRWSVYFIG